jgi:7-carboxy-7-deazaguanine synthase
VNNQKPEPRVGGDGITLDVHSVFFTIQGEGPYTGRRSIFIRLAGCNLQCPGCDTEYIEGRTIRTVEHIRQEIELLIRDLQGALPIIVITGGEPFRQPIGHLVDVLATAGFFVQIETNGVLPPCPVVVHLIKREAVAVIVSPKTVRVNEEWERYATAWKYVLDASQVNRLDGLPIKALGHTASWPGVARPPWRLASKGLIYLNPFDSGDPALNAKNLEAVKASCLEFGYVAGVQLHKLMSIE